MLLTKEQILGADDLPFEDVPVPEWGGTVRVISMMDVEREQFELKFAGKKGEGMAGVKRWLCAMTIADEARKPIFAVSDVDALGRKSGAALNRVFDVAARLNGLTKQDQEELAKN
jgi:hypothetical protein